MDHTQTHLPPPKSVTIKAWVCAIKVGFKFWDGGPLVCRLQVTCYEWRPGKWMLLLGLRGFGHGPSFDPHVTRKRCRQFLNQRGELLQYLIKILVTGEVLLQPWQILFWMMKFTRYNFLSIRLHGCRYGNLQIIMRRWYLAHANKPGAVVGMDYLLKDCQSWCRFVTMSMIKYDPYIILYSYCIILYSSVFFDPLSMPPAYCIHNIQK